MLAFAAASLRLLHFSAAEAAMLSLEALPPGTTAAAALQLTGSIFAPTLHIGFPILHNHSYIFLHSMLIARLHASCFACLCIKNSYISHQRYITYSM